MEGLRPKGARAGVPGGETLSSRDASVSEATLRSPCRNLTGQAWPPAGRAPLPLTGQLQQSAAEWTKSNFIMMFLREGETLHIMPFPRLPGGLMASNPQPSVPQRWGGW